MASDHESWVAIPRAQVFILNLEDLNVVAQLQAAVAQMERGQVVCIVCVRDQFPRYAVVHLEEVQDAGLDIAGNRQEIAARLEWRDGVQDLAEAHSETAILAGDSIIAVALRTDRGHEEAMTAAPEAGDSPFEAVPTAPPPAARTAPGPAPREEPETAATSFTRTPHLDLTELRPVNPGQTFNVQVYLDTEAFHPGEHGEHARFVGDEALIDVYLYASPHFEVLGSNQEKLFVERKKAVSARLSFTLRARSAEDILSLADSVTSVSKGTVSALFMHQGRPCGRVARVIAVAVTTTDTGEDTASEPTVFEVDTTARTADLQVTVIADPINNGRQFHCIVYSPLLQETHESAWNLNEVTSQIVASYMRRFTRGGLTNPQRLDALRGAGIQLFDAAPEVFKDLFWRLVDGDKPFRTIAIVSEEPYIPWELMVPYRSENAQRKTRMPLGVEFAIGRSTRTDLVAPAQKIGMSRSMVIAPKYTGRKHLEKAEEEADMICREFNGTQLAPVLYDNIASEFCRPENQQVDLLHFACHGEAECDDGQIIHLEQDQQLSSIDVTGHEGFATLFAHAKPLVFLNACEVGRPTTALVGIGGFADVFMSLGAKAVVAPLWSVKDTIAHEIATMFYSELKDAREQQRQRTFAGILRDIRARAYSNPETAGEDTYAAYCFYGDPLAQPIE